MEKSFEKKQTIESKEGEKMKNSFIVCRENRLFKKWIPVAEEILSSLGNKVELKSFPAETEPEKIGEWIKANADKIKDGKYIRDNTSYMALNMVIGKMYNEERPKEEIQRVSEIREMLDDSINLDSLFAKATDIATFGKSRYDISREAGDNMKVTGENFTHLIKKILKNKENIPEKVYIFLMGILDHRPFERFERTKEEESHHKAGEKVKEWLIKGGVSADSIVINSEINKENRRKVIEEMHEADDKNNWIISDRHIETYIKNKKDDLILSAKDLELPLENFYGDVQEQGLVEPNPEKMKEVLTGLFKEEFTKESKK